MKKIVMIGALWTSNFGDVLLADLLYKKALEKGFEVKFYNASEKVLNELKVENATLKELINSDYLVFIAGGYLSEPPSNVTRWALSRYKKIFIYADLFRLLNKKYYILDVGAGPINNLISKFILKRFVKNAEDIILRDSTSINAVRRIGIKREIQLSIDYALSIANDKSYNFNIVNKKVALHLSSQKEKLNIYILEYFKNKNIDFWFIEDHFGEYDKIEGQNKEIKIIFNERVIRYTNYKDFITTINSFEFILTSKLHVGIVSSALNKRICSFPYHGKVINYYNEIGRSDLCLEDIKDKKDVFNHIEYCINADPVNISAELFDRLKIIDNTLGEMK